MAMAKGIQEQDPLLTMMGVCMVMMVDVGVCLFGSINKLEPSFRVVCLFPVLDVGFQEASRLD